MVLKENHFMANISLHTLIRECSLKNKNEYQLYNGFSLGNRYNIHKVFKYQKFNYDFTDYLAIYNDGEHIIGNIRASYDDFLYNVSKFLNVPIKGKMNDNEELTKKWLERIEKLKTINRESELKVEFPYLFDDLMIGREYISAVERMRKETEQEQKQYQKDRNYYYGCAQKRSIQNFVKTQAVLYERFTKNRHEYKKEIETKNYNKYIEANFDKNKVAMYIIHTYLSICEATDNPKIYKQYMPIIERYMNSSYQKDVFLLTDEGIRIDGSSIAIRIGHLKKKFTETKEEQVPWKLIQEGRDYRKVSTKKEEKPRKLILDYEKIEKLRKEGERKRTFYESTPYLARVLGLEKYDGYIGYIYPNGEILLDREYKETNLSSAKGDAIYHMKAIDFEALSKLDKTALQKHPRIGRIFHSKNWETKANEIINQENEEEIKIASHILIKKLKEKNS